MKIAMNQPYLFPYIGFFQLINAVDQFVIEDDLQYIKGGWINGNRTLCDAGERILSLPVKKDSHHLNINQRYFADPFETGKQKLLNKIHNDYRKAPYFKEVCALLATIMSCEDKNVASFVANQLRMVSDYLGIRTPFLMSSTLGGQRDGLKGQDWVIATSKLMGAGHYINPIGGVGLYNKDVFESQGIKLDFLRPREIKYKQFDNEFIPWLSIIDVMMFNSRDEIREMLQQFDLVLSGSAATKEAAVINRSLQEEGRRKRILFLGGSYQQIPAIEEARARGWYVITCDYLPDNPGHKLADEYHDVSTTDMEAILDLARSVKPDLVMAYASDPNAPVAAYVSEKMGLPGNTYASVRILSEKDLFRSFLRDHGFNAPRSVGLDEQEVSAERVSGLSLPFIIKPVDASGSKGVVRVEDMKEFEGAAQYALSFSRKHRIIVEEYVRRDGNQLTGDGFVVNGELVFLHFADQYYDKSVSAFVPCCATWPSKKSEIQIKRAVQEAAKAIRAVNFQNGPVNVEVRITPQGEIYIMEIGPRNGGNFMPQAIKYATGFDMVKSSLDVLLGRPVDIPTGFRQCAAYYAVHSEYNGKLVRLALSEKLKPYVREYHQYVFPGQEVQSFQSTCP